MNLRSGATAAVASALLAAGIQSPAREPTPRFARDGGLVLPVDWETWVMVGSSIGLSYREAATPPSADAAPGMFHNVYVQPWAYREAERRGAFPEQTMFVLTFYEASRKANPARAGFYEGDRLPNLEVHIKQRGLDPTGWAFFGFGPGDSVGRRVPGDAACYSCHAKEAAVDNVFVQFYPALREHVAAR